MHPWAIPVYHAFFFVLRFTPFFPAYRTLRRFLPLIALYATFRCLLCFILLTTLCPAFTRFLLLSPAYSALSRFFRTTFYLVFFPLIALFPTFSRLSCFMLLSPSRCRFYISAFVAEVHGRDAYAPSIRVRSAYTFACQAIGWSGKFMGCQLKEARDWSEVAAEASTRQMAKKGPSEFGYDGWELDSPRD